MAQDLRGDFVFDPTDPYAVMQLVIGRVDGPSVSGGLRVTCSPRVSTSPPATATSWCGRAWAPPARQWLSSSSARRAAWRCCKLRRGRCSASSPSLRAVPVGVETAQIDFDDLVSHLLAD